MAHHPASATPHDEPELSPAERYARARAARHHAGSELGRFAARVGFPLDDFQRRACAEVEDGHGVLVAAIVLMLLFGHPHSSIRAGSASALTDRSVC